MHPVYQWNWFEFDISDLGETDIWLKFRYFGVFDHALALDSVSLSYLYHVPDEEEEDDDDDDDDDDADGDSEEDDTAPDESENDDDRDDHDGQCGGCSLSNDSFALPVLFGMFLIGFLAWCVARKKDESEK